MEKIAKLSSKMIAIGAGVVGTYLFFNNWFFTVDGGERGLIFDQFRGVLPKIYGEGMHFRFPII